jgi:hypothetical protein
MDGVARVIQHVPARAFDLDMDFIHAPALAPRVLVLARRSFKQRHPLAALFSISLGGRHGGFV